VVIFNRDRSSTEKSERVGHPPKDTSQNRFWKATGIMPGFTGNDYGNPRSGYDTFDTIIYELTFRRCSDTWDPARNTLTACND
jgi:hypothetical protein